MAFKSPDAILTADPRFASLWIVGPEQTRPMDIHDHHRALAGIDLPSGAPDDVRQAFDRARNVMLYAYFDYDLLIVGEFQAFGAFELALKARIHALGGATRGTLRNLVDQARKHGVLPKRTAPASGLMDPIEALIALRNDLAHGSPAIHSPGMALEALEACAAAVADLYP